MLPYYKEENIEKRCAEEVSIVSEMLDILQQLSAQGMSKCPKYPKCNLLRKTLTDCRKHKQNSPAQRMAKMSGSGAGCSFVRMGETKNLNNFSGHFYLYFGFETNPCYLKTSVNKGI